jgi:hypothetical protein
LSIRAVSGRHLFMRNICAHSLRTCSELVSPEMIDQETDFGGVPPEHPNT